ncbi:MAG TPA: substrate-binding domain-containing protein [Candidatus Limnocylindrales bacterium]|nr:substrate-binding domain-containing protein [Candidatus Limnocylindrales bacterium]
MRRFIGAAFCVSLVFLCILGSPNAQAQIATPAIKVGFLLDSLKVERWQTDVNTFQKRAKELGAESLVETAEGNDELQFEQAKKLLDAGVKSLVIVAHDTSKAARIVSLAKDRHVSVISYDRLIRDASIDLFVGLDVHEIGRLQAKYLTQLAPKGNYVLLEGAPTDINAHLLREGQEEVLQPLADRGDIKIVGDVWCTDWNPLEAYTHMLEIIAKNQGHIDAVVASNDGTATGAVQALEENKLAGKVVVSGQDADLAAVLRLLQGTQSMTVYKPVLSIATQAAEAAVALATGQTPKTTSVILSGGRKVPAILGPAVVVTKYNIIQTVIKDGFQNLDTIKKSLPPEQWPKE